MKKYLLEEGIIVATHIMANIVALETRPAVMIHQQNVNPIILNVGAILKDVMDHIVWLKNLVDWG